MAENDANRLFLEDLGSPPLDTLNASPALPECPLYPSPASDISLKSLTVGGWGQREDGLTPSPYYAMQGCPVHFRYQDLQAKLFGSPTKSRHLSKAVSVTEEESPLLNPRGSSCLPALQVSLAKNKSRKLSETPSARGQRKHYRVSEVSQDRNTKRSRLPAVEELETEERSMVTSWAMQEVLQDVHASLNLLTEARNETNRLLGELIVALESS